MMRIRCYWWHLEFSVQQRKHVISETLSNQSGSLVFTNHLVILAFSAGLMVHQARENLPLGIDNLFDWTDYTIVALSKQTVTVACQISYNTHTIDIVSQHQSLRVVGQEYLCVQSKLGFLASTLWRQSSILLRFPWRLISPVFSPHLRRFCTYQTRWWPFKALESGRVASCPM